MTGMDIQIASDILIVCVCGGALVYSLITDRKNQKQKEREKCPKKK